MKKFLILLLLLLVLVGCKGPSLENYTITFETDTELSIPDLSVTKGRIINLPDDPTREGYTFDWWYIDESCTIPLELNYIPTQSMTIYANWIPDQYQITFITNGGSTIAPVTVDRDKLLVEPVAPTRQDYTFVGWCSDIDLNSLYVFTTPVTSSFTLYAKWEEVLHPLLNLEEYEVTYVVTSLGEDTTKMNVNYQTKNTKTYLELTTAGDTTFTNAVRFDPTMIYFESLSDEMEKVFTGRNICRVDLTNLLPGQGYLYRINKGNNTYTEIYSFHTESNDDTTNFIFMTDVHYYDGYDGAEVSEDVIASALTLQPNLDFVFNTGDIIDTGGNADDWDQYFTHATHFKTLPVAGITGNHEHYYVGAMKNKIYSSYFNYPDNGVAPFKGTSYYFIHNDTLFIQVDTDSPYDQGKQLEWISQTIEANPTKFIIVGTHAPVNSVGSNDYNRAFMEVMEYYAVDLVLAGHYHSQQFDLSYLDQDPLNNQMGVAYFRGAGGGIKGIGAGGDPKEFAKGYVIQVEAAAITIQTINGYGTLGAKYTVYNHKLAEPTETTHQEIMDSIDYQTEGTNITFSWASDAFKNVKSITITQAYREGLSFKTIVPTPGYTAHTFNNLDPTLDHYYTVQVVFKDDSIQEKNFELLLSGGMGLVANPNQASIDLSWTAPTGAILATIKRYDIYVNGVFQTSVNGKDQSFNPITQTTLTGLQAGTDYTIVVKAYGREGYLYSQTIVVKTTN